MAAASEESPEMKDSGDAAPHNMVIVSGEVNYKGKNHQLCITDIGLRLEKTQYKKSDATGVNGVVMDVDWRRVMCACEAPMKKSKSSQTHSESGPEVTRQGGVFIIHYMAKNQKTNKLRCRNISLETTQERAGEWIAKIEEKRKEGKPQKLLIVINPIGGKGTARQTFEKRVQPLFALSGIELVVKVTEREKHAVEIAKTFDVSTVDGIIAISGDGMYMEILHALTLRKQEEAGVDFNDPEAKLVPPAVSVGIIPAGTGNGVSGWLNGVIDVETATLNIIRGVSHRTNIFSVHEPGKLIHYAGLLLANGFFSEMIQRTDELRWMKRARYPYAMMSSMVGKKKVLEFSIEVLRNEQEANNSEDGKAEGATSRTANWTKLGTRQLTATIAIAAKVLDDKELLELNPFYPGFDLFIVDRPSALDNVKFVLSFFTRKKNVLDKEFIEWVRDIRGVRYEMMTSEDTGATSAQNIPYLELCKMLDIDGEIMISSVPKFELRLHPQFLPVYCAPEIYTSLRSDLPKNSLV